MSETITNELEKVENPEPEKKNENLVVVEKPTLEDALKEGAKLLKAKKSQLKYTVIQEGKKGFLGMGAVPFILEIKKVIKKKKLELSKLQSALDEATTLLSNKDGKFEFVCEGGKVVLTVFPPEGEGTPVSLDDVVKEVRRPGVRKLNHQVIQEAIRTADSTKKFIIADFDTQQEFNKDARIILEVSADKMEVHLSVEPPVGTGVHPTLELVQQEIDKKGIKLEPNIEVIKDFLVMKIYDKPIQIITGMQPGLPSDGFIKWCFEKKKDENIDHEAKGHKKIKQINNVNEGDVIGEIIPPEAGIEGINVFGAAVPAKNGKEAVVKLGKNVELTPDNKKIVAMIDGQVVLTRNTIPNVYQIFEVTGNVDLSVGNIDFIGNVVIHGNVCSGFEVKAEGSITVRGTVEMARLESGDSITVGGGILGKEKGIVVAAKSIHCKFAENAQMHAGEEINCQKGLINCKVTAGKKVEVRTSGGGVIVGGQVMAGDEIEADVIGSPMGTKTVIVVGIDLSRQEEVNKNLLQISKMEEQQLKLKRMMDMLKRIEERSPEEDKALKDVTVTYQQLSSQVDLLYRKKDKMEKEIEVNRRGIIRAYNVVHPDVWVRVRRGLQRIDSTIKCSAIGYDGENMRILPID